MTRSVRAAAPALAVLALAACSASEPAADAAEPMTAMSAETAGLPDVPELSVLEKGEIALPDDVAYAVVAGGCFWCVEADLEKKDGVLEVVSGYSGGDRRDVTYRDHEGHREAAIVYYRPDVIDYATLIGDFLRTIDVTDDGGQFCDRGYAYTTAIYPVTDAEAEVARAEIAEAEAALGREIVTPVVPFTFLVTAEDYHQDYYKSDEKILTRFGRVAKSEAYKGYREGCRRDQRLAEVWGDPAP